MRVVALTSSPDFAKVLKAYCDPCGITVTPQPSLAGPAANLARVADVLIIHQAHIDGGTISTIESALQLGYRELFVVSTESARPEWEERAYLAGASIVAAEPLRAQLLVAQLKRVGNRTPAATPLSPPSSSPFSTLTPTEAPSTALELASTRTMVRLLRHAHSADSFTDAFLQHLCDQISVSRLALYLTTLDPFARDMTCIFATGMDAETFKHVALSLDRGIGGFLRQHGVVLTVGGHIQVDAQAAYEMNALGAHVAVPVSDRSSLIGVLLLGRHITGEMLRKDEIEVVFHLMSDMGLVLRNARLNQNLSEERAFFASVLDQIGVGSMVVDSQLRILHANRRLAEAVEHTDDKPLRFEHLPRSLATGVYDVIKRGSSASQAVMLRTGRNETYRASVEPFQLSSTAGPAVLVLTQNFTDVEANRTLAVRNEREELLARMGAQFAHVVRNSLTQLSTVAQLLPTKHQDAEFVADVCSRMPAELGRLLRTADQLEWLNRDVGQSTEIDIAERIEAIWPAAKQFAGAQATETIRLLPAPTTVLCDPNALDRILLEVLTNAAQAASSTGKIEITADEPATDSVTIHVHDDGPGLSEEALRRGSEAFYTTKTSGMGLGLTVVERLLRAHSGKLTLTTSRRLRGADVALTLPTHRP